MQSRQIFASFDFSVEACEPPIEFADYCSIQMPNEYLEREAVKSELALSNGIVMESSAHGTCYRLVRKPVSKPMPVVAPFPELQRPSAKSTADDPERRSNIGSFQRVLVAEDHKGMRRMLVQMLQRWGFEPVTATNGAEVLKIVEQKRPPELILLSQKLPDTDVFELCSRLRDHHRDYLPYILLLATQNDKQGIVHALEAGAAAHLTTPFEAKELRAHLMVAIRILNRQESLLNSRDRFKLLATKDTLTGVWNRRSIHQILNEELDRAARAERATGVLLIDIDHFKRVNDTHGHQAGDFVLQEVSRRLNNALRPYDAIGRYGGEEFLVVVPSSSEKQLRQLAERLREFLSRDPIHVGESAVRITVSVGAAIAAPGEDPSCAIAVADASLYHAKKLGRDRYVYGGQRADQLALSSQSI